MSTKLAASPNAYDSDGTPTVDGKDFKQRCVQLLERLGPEGLIVTKNGSLIARVLPAQASDAELIGNMRDRPIRVSEDDDLFSTGAWFSDEWGDFKHVR